MKLFSRANVPTLEAGTFPAQRPGTATSNGSANAAASMSVSTRPATATGSIINSTSRFFPNHMQNTVERPITASASVMMPPPRMNTTMSAESKKPENDIAPYNGTPAICQTIDNFLAKANKVGPETLPANHLENQNEQAAKSAIDLYTPRPSTAPEATSQHLSQLPPRRDLPFTKRGSGGRISASRPSGLEDASCASGPKTKHQAAQAPELVGEAGSQEEQSIDKALQPGPVKRKRPATRASTKKQASTESVAKKPRAAASRKKKGKETKESTPVPSVEELLEKHAVDTSGEQAIDAKAMDTQALLDKIGHLQNEKMQGGIEQDHRKRVQVEVAAASVEVPDSQASLSAEQPSHLTDLLPCTPADKLIKPGTPLAPAAVHTANILPTPDDSSPVKHPSRTKHASGVDLEADPKFTDWKQKGNDWAAQSDVDKQKRVKDFARQCLWDDDFMELCKVMEPLVETAMMSDRYDRYVGSSAKK